MFNFRATRISVNPDCINSSLEYPLPCLEKTFPLLTVFTIVRFMASFIIYEIQRSRLKGSCQKNLSYSIDSISQLSLMPQTTINLKSMITTALNKIYYVSKNHLGQGAERRGSSAWSERSTHNRKAAGSSPASGMYYRNYKSALHCKNKQIFMPSIF
jgi:hypothetical protein